LTDKNRNKIYSQTYLDYIQNEIKIIFIVLIKEEIMKQISPPITGTADAFVTNPSLFFVYLCSEKVVQ